MPTFDSTAKRVYAEIDRHQEAKQSANADLTPNSETPADSSPRPRDRSQTLTRSETKRSS